MKIHASCPPIISRITIPEKMVQEPSYDEIVFRTVDPPMCIPLADLWRSVLEDLTNGTVNR